MHKIVSNKKEVLEAIPAEDHAKGIKELNLAVDPLPIERALGVMWCVESDSFRFRIELRDCPLTRRGVLSVVGSIYDSNGYLAPVTLKGKQILQQMCKDKLDWDSPVPDYLRPEWEKWRQEIIELEKLEIQRCYKPENFGPGKAVEVHYFSRFRRRLWSVYISPTDKRTRRSTLFFHCRERTSDALKAHNNPKVGVGCGYYLSKNE